MPVDVKYTTSATATGGRDGRRQDRRRQPRLKLTTPKELGGAGGDGHQPRAAVRARLFGLLPRRHEGRGGQGGVKVPDDATVTATVGIGPRSEGGFGIDVELDVRCRASRARKAEELVAKAHEVCPYCDATRGNVDVKVRVA